MHLMHWDSPLCLLMKFLFAYKNKKFSCFIYLFIFFFCTFRYDAEAIYFDEGVRSAKREQLEAKLLQVIPPNSVFV